MKTTPLPPFSPLYRAGSPRLRGSAIIVCLLLIVVMTILIVGLISTARTELTTVAAHRASDGAEALARMGVDVVRARIAEATSVADVPWSTTPGRILRYETKGAEPVEVPLFSGEAAAVAADVSVNLNPPALIRNRGLITADSEDLMPQQWIYLREDGTLSPPGTVPAYSATNPVVGRFAFWSDDASARINANTAWTRRSANGMPGGHPSKVELAGSPDLQNATDIDAIEQFRRAHGGFATVQELATVNNGVGTAYSAAPEAFTHYNCASLLNPFGGPRFFLTTQQSNLAAGEANFFDILNTPNTAPSKRTNLSNAKVESLFKTLYDLLSRKDWPINPGRSFVDKYGAKETAQIILNLIEYVRSSESSDTLVEPLRGTFSSANGTFTVDANATAASIFGNSRRPLMTEMAVQVPLGKITVDNKEYYQCQVYIEIHLPASAGGTIHLVNDAYSIYVTNLTGGGTAAEGLITASEIRGAQSPLMQPGDYRTIIRPFLFPVTSTTDGKPPLKVPLRLAISRQVGTSLIRVDIAPIATSGALTYNPIPGTPESGLQSLAIDDPHVKHHLTDWTLGPQTFDAPPAASARQLGNPANTVLWQDHDADGNVTDTSVRFPAPNSGIGSLGLLGQVHSGMVGATGAGGVFWRTLRFQPSGAQAQELPDWALLELFATPMGSAGAVAGIYPQEAVNGHIEARGGLVNLNSLLYPYKDDADDRRRDLPLRMLLKNVSGVATDAALETLVDNIQNRTLDPDGKRYGSQGSYQSPGEIVEILGIANSGEASETRVGELIEQLTTQSSTFIVYSVGEKVTQNAAGKLFSTGQRRLLSLVEKAGSEVRVVYEEELGL